MRIGLSFHANARAYPPAFAFVFLPVGIIEKNPLGDADLPDKRKVLDLSNPDPNQIRGIKRTPRKNQRTASRVVQMVVGIILLLIILAAGYWTFEHFHSSNVTPSQSSFEQKNAAP